MNPNDEPLLNPAEVVGVLNARAEEVLMLGLVRLRNQLRRPAGEDPVADRAVVEYLAMSPSCRELFVLWDHIAINKMERVEPLICNTIDAFLGFLRTREALSRSEFTAVLSNVLASNRSKMLASALDGGRIPTSLAVLAMLTSIAKCGPRAVESLLELVDIGGKGVLRLASIPKKKEGERAVKHRQSTREVFLEFAMSCFESASSATKKTILQVHPFVAAVFQHLPEDPLRVIRRVLPVIKQHVLEDDLLTRSERTNILSLPVLENLLRLYSRDATTREFAHGFFTSILTVPGTGLCFTDYGWYHTDKDFASAARTSTLIELDPTNAISSTGQTNLLRNFTLLRLLPQLQILDDKLQRELGLGILRSCSNLVHRIWTSVSLPIEPKLTLRWLTTIQFLASVFQSPIPELRAYPPPAAVVVGNILPGKLFARGVLTRCLQHTSGLVQHHTLLLVNASLQRLAHFTAIATEHIQSHRHADEWTRVLGRTQREIFGRIPDVASIISIASAVKPTTDNPSSVPRLVQTAALSVLKEYIAIFADSLQGKLDSARLLTHGIISMNSLEASRTLAFLNTFPIKLNAKSRDSKDTNLAMLLKVLLLSPSPQTSLAARRTLALQLSRSPAFEHDAAEAYIWLDILMHFCSTCRSNGSSIDLVVQVMDSAFSRFSAAPYRYLDQCHAEVKSFHQSFDDNSMSSSSTPILQKATLAMIQDHPAWLPFSPMFYSLVELVEAHAASRVDARFVQELASNLSRRSPIPYFVKRALGSLPFENSLLEQGYLLGESQKYDAVSNAFALIHTLLHSGTDAALVFEWLADVIPKLPATTLSFVQHALSLMFNSDSVMRLHISFLLCRDQIASLLQIVKQNVLVLLQDPAFVRTNCETLVFLSELLPKHKLVRLLRQFIHESSADTEALVSLLLSQLKDGAGDLDASDWLALFEKWQASSDPTLDAAMADVFSPQIVCRHYPASLSSCLDLARLLPPSSSTIRTLATCRMLLSFLAIPPRTIAYLCENATRFEVPESRAIVALLLCHLFCNESGTICTAGVFEDATVEILSRAQSDIKALASSTGMDEWTLFAYGKLVIRLADTSLLTTLPPATTAAILDVLSWDAYPDACRSDLIRLALTCRCQGATLSTSTWRSLDKYVKKFGCAIFDDPALSSNPEILALTYPKLDSVVLKVLLQSHQQSPVSSQEVCTFSRYIFRCASDISHSEELGAVMQLFELYRATTRPCDRSILALSQKTERRTNSSVASLLIANGLRAHGDPSYISLQQVIDNFDDKATWNTINMFPVSRTLHADGDDVAEDDNRSQVPDTIYDPAFILPLIKLLVASSLPAKSLVSSNSLGIVISALSSLHAGVRRYAYTILDQVQPRLRNSRYPGHEQVSMVVEWVRNGIVDRDTPQRLPSVITTFASHAIAVMINPGHFLYRSVNAFLLQRALPDFLDVPMFFELFNSSSVSCRKDRVWLFRILSGGLRCQEDYAVYRRRHVIELLMSFYTSSLCDNFARKLIFEIFSKAMRLPNAAEDVLCNHGFISWLSCCTYGTWNGVSQEFELGRARLAQMAASIRPDLANRLPTLRFQYDCFVIAVLNSVDQITNSALAANILSEIAGLYQTINDVDIHVARKLIRTFRVLGSPDKVASETTHANTDSNWLYKCYPVKDVRLACAGALMKLLLRGVDHDKEDFHAVLNVLQKAGNSEIRRMLATISIAQTQEEAAQECV